MLYRSNIIFNFTLILTLIVGFLLYAYNNPKHSWDTIPYVALVLSYENTELKEIHSQTYELLKKSLSADNYEFLIKGTKYREQIFKDWEALKQQLPFYSIKPLFLITTYLLSKIGFSVVDALILVPALSLVATGLLLIFWLSFHYTNIQVTVLVPALLILLCQITGNYLIYKGLSISPILP